MTRVTSIDVTRGLVMVVMALDHVRDLLHITAAEQDPTDLTTTTPVLFLTRWITHLCAPTFVFLSGTSAYLSLQKQAQNGQDVEAGRRFLRQRGLVLVVLELTLINFAFWFEFPYRVLLLQVIWAIGFGLIGLSFLSRLRVQTVGIIGLLIMFGHNLLQFLPPISGNAPRFISSLFFRTDLFQITPKFAILVGYPLIPWLGIMLLGYAIGPLFQKSLANRRLWLAQLGLGSLAVFTLLRYSNLYGDPALWSGQKDAVFTVLSFINVSKYPPSLLYCLLMLGIALLILTLTDGLSNAFTRILTVYGAVPMFYYILHWYLIHLLMLAVSVGQGASLSEQNPNPFTFGRPVGIGVSLEWVYLIWIGLVVALYPLCRWYGRYKSAHPEKVWLRYV
ncbi:MAG: DUF1624 domain-containing protein [Cytophagales bacterium]|nr:MAG: DUF1624 domain-containing protein [Cytophagales bacterium]